MAEFIIRCKDCKWWDDKRVLEDPKLCYEPIGVCTRSDPRTQGCFTNFDFYCGCGEKMNENQGKWIEIGDELKCSICGGAVGVLLDTCPDCKAKMDRKIVPYKYKGKDL